MELEHSHDSTAIAERLAAEAKPSYLRDFVYGGIDGSITTFAVVAGVMGAELSPAVVLILGLANLVADGFSMAASNYSGTKTVIDDIARLTEIERKHIRLDPDGEREEVRQILAAKGLTGSNLEEATNTITAREGPWIDLMLAEEYGLARAQPVPIRAAMVTFFAFLLCGTVPLLPFAFGLPQAFETSIIATGIVFFIIGAAKSVWSLSPWWRSGLETFAIGCAASTMAYVVGVLLKGIV